jgi:hypothetical protein
VCDVLWPLWVAFNCCYNVTEVIWSADIHVVRSASVITLIVLYRLEWGGGRHLKLSRKIVYSCVPWEKQTYQYSCAKYAFNLSVVSCLQNTVAAWGY